MFLIYLNQCLDSSESIATNWLPPTETQNLFPFSDNSQAPEECASSVWSTPASTDMSWMDPVCFTYSAHSPTSWRTFENREGRRGRILHQSEVKQDICFFKDRDNSEQFGFAREKKAVQVNVQAHQACAIWSFRCLSCNWEGIASFTWCVVSLSSGSINTFFLQRDVTWVTWEGFFFNSSVLPMLSMYCVDGIWDVDIATLEWTSVSSKLVSHPQT